MKNSRDEGKPDIFRYDDHVEFLRDHLTFLKSGDRSFSLRKLAKSAGLAVGYLPMVISRKRVLSLAALDKIIPHIKLSDRDSKVLKALHRLATADNPVDRVEAIERMGRLAEFSKRNRKDLEVFQYLSKWYYVAIREMVTLDEFCLDPKWIQKRLNFKLSLIECEQAISFLTNNGFITSGENGKFQVNEKNLDCRSDFYRPSLAAFHKQMFDLASQAIEKVPRNERYIGGITFPIARQDFEEVRKIVDEAIEKINAISKKPNQTTDVYQIEIATFPLTSADNTNGEDK